MNNNEDNINGTTPSISTPSVGTQPLETELITDVDKLRFLITCATEYDMIMISEFITLDWKEKFSFFLSDENITSITIFKKKLNHVLEDGVSLFCQNQKVVFLLGNLYHYINEVINSHLRSKKLLASEHTSFCSKALVLTSEEGVLFSGIKKVPGFLPLAESVQEFNVVNTHSHIVPQNLSKYSTSLTIAKQGYARNFHRVLPAEPAFFGVYSSFAPSYDSSYSHLTLQDSYALDSQPSEVTPDFDLLKLEGIDPEFLLEDSMKHEISEELFSTVGLYSNSEINYEYSNNSLIEPSQNNFGDSFSYDYEIAKNATLLKKLANSQNTRLRYRDYEPRPYEIKLASEFLESTTKLVGNLAPSKFISESGAHRALRRFPYKEVGFKGTLNQSRAYAKSKRPWPSYTNA